VDRKRLFLLVILVLLAVLVVLDYSDIEIGMADLWSGRPERAAPASRAVVEDRLRALQRAVSAREDIERTYGEVAVRYASRVAELDTLMFDDRDPRRAALDLLNRRLGAIRHLRVNQVTAEEPRAQGEGISLVSLAVELEAPTHEAAMQALLGLSRPDRGYAWEDLDVEADAEAKRVRISGKVLTVMIQAAE
jgi:hypothetical protein